jgi:hypothetical protein
MLEQIKSEKFTKFPYNFNEEYPSKGGFSDKFKITEGEWLGKKIYTTYLIGNNHPDAESNNKATTRKKEFESLQLAIDYLKEKSCIN